MPADAPLYLRLATEIKGWPLLHAAIGLLPFVVLAMATGGVIDDSMPQ